MDCVHHGRQAAPTAWGCSPAPVWWPVGRSVPRLTVAGEELCGREQLCLTLF